MTFGGPRVRLCPSLKLSYLDREAAQEAAAERPRPTRTYRCWLCGLWHYTTQPYDQARRDRG